MRYVLDADPSAIAMLEHLGVDHEVAVNGCEAVAQASRGQLVVVLMDCQMPMMDGYEAARKIRVEQIRDRGDRPIPIVALTANVFEADRQRCLQAGMDGFLTKSLSVEVLHSELSRVLSSLQWRSSSEQSN